MCTCATPDSAQHPGPPELPGSDDYLYLQFRVPTTFFVYQNRVQNHERQYVCVCGCLNVCICMCIYVYKKTYIYIYVHKHEIHLIFAVDHSGGCWLSSSWLASFIHSPHERRPRPKIQSSVFGVGGPIIVSRSSYETVLREYSGLQVGSNPFP